MQRNRLALAECSFRTGDRSRAERCRRRRRRRWWRRRFCFLSDVENQACRELNSVQPVALWYIDAACWIVRQAVSGISRHEAARIKAKAEMVAHMELNAASIVQGDLQVVVQVSRVKNCVRCRVSRNSLGGARRSELRRADAHRYVRPNPGAAAREVENRIQRNVVNAIAEVISRSSGLQSELEIGHCYSVYSYINSSPKWSDTLAPTRPPKAPPEICFGSSPRLT